MAYLAQTPLLHGIEGWATDWLFRHGRPDAPPPSPDIVHVDIDDNALESVGRWPWPRQRIADAVTAMDRMGARVIALDLLLIDPQPPEYLPDGTRIDHDAVLADALRKVRAKTVLAAKVDRAGTRLSAMWKTSEGRRKWQTILELLRADITRDPETVIALAELDGRRAARVRGRIGAIKRVVVRQVAEELLDAGHPCTETTLRAALLPREKNENLGEFPALDIIRSVVALEEALRSVERSLPDAHRNHEYVRVDDVLPPRPAFARAVTTVAIVNSDQDRDGQLRRTVLRWERNGKIHPQFGAAAAAAYLDEPLSQLARPQVEIGRFRLGSEKMLLSWPAIDRYRPIVGLARHVSLGRVLGLLDAERARDRLAAEHDAHTRQLVAEFLSADYAPSDFDDPELRPQIIEELEGLLPLVVGDGDEEGEDEQARQKMRAARIWLNQERELARSAAVLADARAELTAFLENKLVFVGWYATGNFGDFYPTAAHERTPGIVAHAIVAHALLTGYVVQMAPVWLGALVTFLLGAAVAFLTFRVEPRLGFLLTFLFALLYFAVNTIAVFNFGHVALALTTPLLGIFAAWAGTVTMNAVRELREKAQLRRQFGARISKQLFDFLIENPDRVHLEGKEKEVTCFFSDLAGFTSISESLDSRFTVALLNRYMWAMNDELTRLQAYVNKFLGDGIMAVWGAFGTDTEHADRACRAALACFKRLETLNETPAFATLPRLSMRVGIATGVVTVGDCGAPPDLRDYTVIGDAANLAARLESANKQFGTGILINGRTKELLSEDLLTRPLGRITVVGQKTATEVHELVCLRGEATPAQLESVAKTAAAVALFQERRLEEAREAWRALQPSRLADLYLKEIEHFLLAADRPFHGILELTSK